MVEAGVVDVLVGDEPDGVGIDGARQHAVVGEARRGDRRGAQRRVHTRCSCAPSAGSTLPGKASATASASTPGAGVVVGQALDHRLQRDDAGGRDDPRLAHLTAEPRPVRARRPRCARARPHSTEPTGAASPFDRQNIAVSHPRRASTAPRRARRRRSRCARRRSAPRSRARARRPPTRRPRPPPIGRPLAGMCVFSRNSALDVGEVVRGAGERVLDVVRVQPTVGVGQRAAAARPRSPRTRPARAGRRGRARRRAPRCRARPACGSAIWLAIVPDGT